MLLTPEQLQKVQKIVEKHHNAFIVSAIGPEAVDPGVLTELEQAGLIEGHLNSVEQAYLYGQLLGILQNKATANMSFDAFQKYVRKNPIPLSVPEQRAVKFAQLSAAGYLKGLGNKVNQQTGNILIEADAKLRAKLERVVRDKTAQNIAKRETAKQLKSDLGWASEDWTRDWDRIAVTEKQTAMQTGLADHIAKRYGEEALVAKRVMPDACFTAGTLVHTRSGEIPIEQVRIGEEVLTHKLRWRKVTHAFQRHFSGKLIGIDGQKPYATENHPFLVNMNWRRADSIHCGDYLVCATVGNAQHDPALLPEEKLFDLISSTDGSRVMPPPAVYLYRYLQMRDSNVDVEFIESEFKYGMERCESFGQGLGGGSNRALGALIGQSFGMLRSWAACQFTRFTRILGEGFSLFGGHSAQVGDLAFGSAGYGDIPFTEAAFDCGTAGLKVPPQRPNRMFSGFPESNQFGFGNIASTVHAQPISFYARGVNSIAVVPFTGEVFNLEVEEDESYFANGLAVHNCKHCDRLYNGPDGNPRIFPLSTLVANGTNVGKKTAEWQAVIGTIHPHCSCQLLRIPDGYGFNKEGELVPGGKGGKVYKSEEALMRALLREDDLRKALSSGEQLVHLWGLPIHIENPKGTSRTFHTPDGGTDKTWMLHAYGEILGTTGADDDPLDVFIGPDPDSEMAYVIEQQNPETGIWDEQKCMLGFSNQEDAERAYGLSYDRPEKFFLQTNPMDIEAFKRWVGLTRVQSAEESPKLRLVIPLSGLGKGGQVSADIGAATSQAGNRAGGHGTAANYLVETPKRRVPEKGPNPHIDPADLLRDWKDEEEEVAEGLKRDKEIYTVTEPLRNVYPIVLPDAAVTGQDSAREGTEERRRYVIGNTAKVALRPQDKADLEKSMAAIIATGPRGGKIVAWDGNTPIYFRNGGQTKEPGWTARLMTYLDGHLRPHHTDPDLVVLKFAPGHKGVIEQLRKHFQIEASIEPGPTYNRITVSRDLFQKIENADPLAVFPEKAEKPGKPKPAQAPALKVKADTVFAPSKVERVGEIQLVPKSELKVPKVLKGYMRNGAKLTAIVKGQEIPGTYIGTDQAGHPIVDFGPDYQGPHDKNHSTQLHFEDWKGFKSNEAGPEHYKSAVHDLPEKSFVRPNERHQKILDELMATAAVGTHTPTEYVDWLWERGRETYLVGGAVRDLLNLVQEGSEITDEKVISKLKDFDMVTTADATVMKTCFNKVGADLPGDRRITSKAPGDEAWMTVCATKSGPGIDLTGMVSYTTADGEQCANPVNGKWWPDIRVDHEMRKDFERRDFTCNSIYYDPKNKVIVDPTGRGIADAQAKVLRLPIPIKDMPQNDSLSCRYYKFRMRDWIPDKDTHDQCIAHFEATFKKLDTSHRAAILYRTVCKKGGTPEENLAKLRKIMESDGVGHLYNEYIAVDQHKIVAWISEKLKSDKNK
jgi:hypothetical protein